MIKDVSCFLVSEVDHLLGGEVETERERRCGLAPLASDFESSRGEDERDTDERH